jgi:hypothetical protein
LLDVAGFVRANAIQELFAGLGIAIVLFATSYGAEPQKQTKRSSNADHRGRQPVHLVVKSRAEIKRIFTYFPFPSVPIELQGYTGSKVGGVGVYRLTVDAQGAVHQVSILKGFTVLAVYDERFSDIKGNSVPALDKIITPVLARWRAKPGPMRVVDVYWSFGPRPWENYGKPNVIQ